MIEVVVGIALIVNGLFVIWVCWALFALDFRIIGLKINADHMYEWGLDVHKAINKLEDKC